MSDELPNGLTNLITQNMEKMLDWEILLSKSLENGSVLSIRKGDFIEKEWWAVFLEAQVDNEEHLKDIPPQEEWGEFALMSFQIGDRGMVLWVFSSINELTLELTRLFGMFTAKITTEI